MDLAFYTYFYGSDNNSSFIIPDVPSLQYKCYYYTNNKLLFNKLSDTKWIPVYDDVQTTDDIIESSMIGKTIKTSPHKYKEIQDYSYLCYIDNKLKDISDTFVEEMITKYFIEKNYALLIRKHWYVHHSVWHEYFEALKQNRYLQQNERYNKYINNQIDAGLKDTTLHHCATGYLIRNMKHEKINEINDVWYKHVQDCGIHCQISFFFVKQLFEESIYVFTDDPHIKI